MKLPSLLHHIFNPDSRKVGFGYQVFIWATYGLFAGKVDMSHWAEATWLAMGLIGGGTVADKILAGNLMPIVSALTGKSMPPPPAPAPAAETPK